jgi:F-type H+-transporting ATPase subunit b
MEALGIDLKSLLFQLGNFIVLFVLLYFILHKPLRTLIEKRNQEIAEGLENAEKARVQLSEAEKKQKELLDAAEKQGRAMVEEVKTQAKALEAKLHQEAQDKAEKLLERTREEISHERDQLRTELKGELATMVVQATSKVLENDITKPEKTEQIKKLVKEIK